MCWERIPRKVHSASIAAPCGAKLHTLWIWPCVLLQSSCSLLGQLCVLLPVSILIDLPRPELPGSVWRHLVTITQASFRKAGECHTLERRQGKSPMSDTNAYQLRVAPMNATYEWRQCMSRLSGAFQNMKSLCSSLQRNDGVCPGTFVFKSGWGRRPEFLCRILLWHRMDSISPWSSAFWLAPWIDLQTSSHIESSATGPHSSLAADQTLYYVYCARAGSQVRFQIQSTRQHWGRLGSFCQAVQCAMQAKFARGGKMEVRGWACAAKVFMLHVVSPPSQLFHSYIPYLHCSPEQGKFLPNCGSSLGKYHQWPVELLCALHQTPPKKNKHFTHPCWRSPPSKL